MAGGEVFALEIRLGYLLLMVMVSMALRMILGSNMTTLSVAVSGMIILCGQAVCVCYPDWRMAGLL